MGNFDDDRSRRRNALGKGLGALIPRGDSGEEKRRNYVTLPLHQIHPARSQPRVRFDEDRLAELAESIRESGLIQPLVVREKQGRYELIAGERRLRACEIAGVEDVPVVIKDVSDSEAFTLALIENIQREDLNPVEEAMAYQKLLDDSVGSQAEVAKLVGKSRSAVTNALRLLDLPDEVLEMVAGEELSSGHARALVTLSAEEAAAMARRIVEEGWSVRKTEEAVRALKEGRPPKKSQGSRYRDDALVRDVTERLQRRLGTKVKLKDRDGKGRIEIYYTDLDVLQSVLDRLFEE